MAEVRLTAKDPEAFDWGPIIPNTRRLALLSKWENNMCDGRMTVAVCEGEPLWTPYLYEKYCSGRFSDLGPEGTLRVALQTDDFEVFPELRGYTHASILVRTTGVSELSVEAVFDGGNDA